MLLQKIKDGRTDLVFDYLQQGGKANDRDENNYPILGWCAYYGDVSAIKYLLKNGAKLSLLGENLGLNSAAFYGHWQLCQFLLENGAKANTALSNTGESPLHNCLCAGNRLATRWIVQLLLAYGADPNALTLDKKETGSFMRDAYTKKESPLHRAAAFADAETIQLLLDAGADKTLKDSHGNSALSWASWHLRPGKILSLLAYGAHQIHPLHVSRMQSDHGHGLSTGMAYNLLGKIHV